jgi:hypothetical protein
MQILSFKEVMAEEFPATKHGSIAWGMCRTIWNAAINEAGDYMINEYGPHTPTPAMKDEGSKPLKSIKSMSLKGVTYNEPSPPHFGFCEDCNERVETEPYNPGRGVYVCTKCGQFTKPF